MPKVKFEQTNTQAVFVVTDDDGNEFRDAIIMDEAAFKKLTPAERQQLAFDRHNAFKQAVVRASSAPAPAVDPDVILSQIANLEAQKASLTQQLLDPEVSNLD